MTTIIEQMARAIDVAGLTWLEENPGDGDMRYNGWGDVPDKVFATTALIALRDSFADPVVRAAIQAALDGA